MIIVSILASKLLTPFQGVRGNIPLLYRFPNLLYHFIPPLYRAPFCSGKTLQTLLFFIIFAALFRMKSGRFEKILPINNFKFTHI